jgi:hypothetical protein
VHSIFYGLRSACSGVGQAAINLLLLCVIGTFGSVWQAQAAPTQSPGCSAINATWGGGVTLADEQDLWNQGPIAGLSVLAGEKITYAVRTSGTSVANAGFAIYKNNGANSASDIILEEYASPGNELNLNATHVVSADDDGYVIYAWSYGGGTVEATVTCAAAESAPSISAHPGNLTVAAGGNASFSATANDATSYQWQVDTGSGFANIANGGVYSGANTSVLTITGAPAGMNGYLYRMVATGNTSPAATSNAATLTVVVAPSITAISPSSGPVAGGTSVTLSGADLSGASSVTFGGTAAPSFTVVNDTTITAVTPAHAAGAGDVSVITSAGTASLINGYTYLAPSTDATLSNLTLDSGTLSPAFASGTTSYTVAVANSVSSIAVTPTVNETNAIVKVNGAVAAGSAISIPLSVGGNTIATVVTAEDGTTTKTYNVIVTRAGASIPTLGSISPSSGSLTGGTPVSIVGTNFTGTTAVTFGGLAASAYTVNSSTSITATTPAHAAGAVDIVVVGANGSATLTNGYAYIASLALSPADGALPAGTIGVAYSQTITASGGTASYSYVVSSGALPGGLLLNGSSGVISGTPTASDSFSFTVTATDANAATNSASYAIAVSSPPASFTFSPSGGALTEAMANEDYSQQITASGGSGSLIYGVASGALPAGLVLNISTGELTGPLSADTEGDYSFTLEVRDSNGSTGTANFTLKVKPRAIAVADKVVDVPAGSAPNDVYLNSGATGGPFTSAEASFVEPADAGTASIIRGQLAQIDPVVAPIGWYLQFKPNPAYSGQVRVGFRLTSALGASNTGTVIYNLGFDAAEVAKAIDTRVRGFVQSRQNMISSTIKMPGLVERRRVEMTTDPVTARMSPSRDGVALGLATSLAQMQAAGDNASGTGGAASLPFNIWVDGAFLVHNRDDNGSKWGSFGMVSIGADYLLSEKALLGLSLHYDRMTDPTDEDAKLAGNGWLAGPYASFEIGRNVFWDTSLLYGGSSNDIDTQFWDGTFDTRRWLFDSSLKGQWQLDDITVLTPRLRAVYFSEKVEDYAVRNDAGDLIELDGFAQEQLRLSLGAEIARSFVLANGSAVTPKLGVAAGYSGLDGSGLFGSVSTGLSLQTTNDWTIDAGLLFNIEGEGEKSVGVKLGASSRF